MNIFETMGQAQMLLGDGNRQLASALAAGPLRVMRRLARLLGEATRHVPRAPLYPF